VEPLKLQKIAHRRREREIVEEVERKHTSRKNPFHISFGGHSTSVPKLM